jgi:glycosyltransferase involved in cell wall biosynthesis
VSREVLYLTPYPPTRSGIADYAETFRLAVERHTPWRLQPLEPSPRLRGNRPHDVLAARRRVQDWLGSGRLQAVSLVHAELGLKQYDEFWTLFWLQRLAPGVRCCITVHDPPLLMAPTLYPLVFGSGRTLVRHAVRVLDYTPLGRALTGSVLRRARAVLALSVRGTDALRRRVPLPGRLRHLPFLAIAPPEVPARAVDHPMRVLFLGFWAPSKGLEALVEATRRALSRQPGAFEVTLAGGVDESGTNRAYVDSMLTRLAASGRGQAFRVTGFLPAAELDRACAEADVLALPTTRTASMSASSVLFRALGAGLPVVASDLGTLGEEVRHLETGLLVPPADPDALADALLKLAADPALRGRLGRNARAHVEAEHGPARVAHEAAAVYEAASRA